MKKVLMYVVSGIILLSIVSCGAKKAENLEDLKKKYDGKEFKNCDKFLEAAEEIFDVYFATIDKAVEGDEQAKKDVESFDKFLEGFEGQAEKFEKECPEKFAEFEKKLETKMEEYMSKLMKLYGFDDLFEGMDDEWEDTEWEEELTEEVVE
jgi:hypothetical protein